MDDDDDVDDLWGPPLGTVFNFILFVLFGL